MKTLFLLITGIILPIFTFSQDYYDSPKVKTDTIFQSADIFSVDRTSFGLGMGLDYGGFGGNITIYPTSNLGLFAGGGYALIGVGYNLGIKYRFISKPLPKRATWSLLGMYGYNAALGVKDASYLDKMFYGATIGVGFDHRKSPQSRNYWSYALLIPIRSSDVDAYINELRYSYGVTFERKLLPFTISMGYRFAGN